MAVHTLKINSARQIESRERERERKKDRKKERKREREERVEASMCLVYKGGPSAQQIGGQAV